MLFCWKRAELAPAEEMEVFKTSTLELDLYQIELQRRIALMKDEYSTVSQIPYNDELARFEATDSNNHSKYLRPFYQIFERQISNTDVKKFMQDLIKELQNDPDLKHKIPEGSRFIIQILPRSRESKSSTAIIKLEPPRNRACFRAAP